MNRTDLSTLVLSALLLGASAAGQAQETVDAGTQVSDIVVNSPQ